MAYGSADGVAALIPAVGAVGVDTTPTATHVAAWLAQGAAVIDRHLASAGYTVPVASTATLYPELTALNNLYAAAYALLAYGVDTASGEQDSRSAVWLDRFQAQLTALVSADLTLAGATVATTTTAPRRRARFVQVKRVDGYSAPHDDISADYDMDT